VADIYQPLSERERTFIQKLGINADALGPEFWSLVRRQLEQTPPAITAASLSGLAGAVNDLLPWTIDLDVLMTAKANTNWDSVTVDAACVFAARKESSGAQNDLISWDVLIPAGTWTFELMYTKDSNRGIYSVFFDDTLAGTIDGYNIGTTRNVRSSITAIVRSSQEVVTLMLAMKTKNAASTNYLGSIQAIQLRRTA
jgi:hypothetical protein